MRFALVSLILGLAPLAAADKPAATLQMLSGGKLLKDVREAAQIVGGDVGRKFIDDQLRELLGEKGFQGLDLGKPLLGYVNFDTVDPDKFAFIALVPITTEADFFEFLKRCHVEPQEVKDQKGLYSLGQFDLPQDDKPLVFEVTMRVVGNHAYVGFNAKGDSLDVAKVYKPEQIYDANDTALLSYKQYNDRIPEAVLRGHLKNVDEMMAKLKQELGASEGGKMALKSVEKMVIALSSISLQSKETGTRILLDTASGELTMDAYYTPKPGTDLAKSVSARKPSMNQFGKLLDDSTAAGLMIQFPVGMPEMQELMVFGLEEAQKAMKDEQVPAYAKEVLDEGLKGMIRTVKSGNLDFANVLSGPDKDGHFTWIGALSFEDATPLEKAIRNTHKSFPAEIRDTLKFDVDKVASLNMHCIEMPEGEDRQAYARMFGDTKVYVVFGPKAIYAAIGNGSKDMLKTAINGKPGPAKAFDVLLNPKKAGQLMVAAEPNFGEQAVQVLGGEDAMYSALSLSISGGDALRVGFSMNLKVIPRIIYKISEMQR